MSHLALGDYVYQGPFLKRLAQHHSNMQLDIWLDDGRWSSKPWHAGRSKVLSEWLSSEGCFNHIYPIASSRQHRREMINSCRAENYDLVLFIASHRSARFAEVARKICHSGFSAGISIGDDSTNILNRHKFKSLNGHARLESKKQPKAEHISDRYRQRYATLLGQSFISQVEDSFLPINVPVAFSNQAKVNLLEVNSDIKTIVFNPISTSVKRNYSWQKLVDVICLLHAQTKCQFVLNLPPDRMAEFEQHISSEAELAELNIRCFSAQQHFYELPALLQQADCVVTVETATMHIAGSLGVKQVVLMRESAHHWQPKGAQSILYAQHRVDEISPKVVAQSVLQVLQDH